MKSINSKVLRQKRFGQYFSGEKVADLLVSLIPEKHLIHTVIDPMMGIGDMLSAVQRAGIEVEKMVGIEIDDTIKDECINNVPVGNLVFEDAFSSNEKYMSEGWDLVITNPPYVRYQLQTDDVDCVMPDGNKIRKNLLQSISLMPNLRVSEKKMFLELVRGYSGLADMAVPSWILCASMVKQNGYLAIVVPDSWLSREYASPVQYMLLKCFDVITIARDIGAAWFENALIRTCLIVAKRNEIVDLLDSKNKRTYYINLGPDLIGERSLVDNICFESTKGINALQKLMGSQKEVKTALFNTYLTQTYALFPNLMKSKEVTKWSSNNERLEISDAERLPLGLKLLGYNFYPYKFTTIEKMGLYCGQGLRTGANDFFYGTICGELPEEIDLDSKYWYSKKIKVPKKYVIKTLQNRREIGGLYVDSKRLKTALIYLTNSIREKDKNVLSAQCKQGFDIASQELSDYIDAAEVYISPKGKRFAELSAVKPNEKKDSTGYFRFWYMLPALTKRHLPNMCITRICSKSVECLYIAQSNESPIAVDANFVTLWCDNENIKMAMLALLNSTWFRCNMELVCTVMGGGALKVEANHLKTVLFPQYTSEQLVSLASCGNSICKAGDISSVLQKEIDLATLAPFYNIERKSLLAELKRIQQSKMRERGVAYDEQECVERLC